MMRRLAAIALCLLSLPLCAQDWPAKPVTLVVAFAPGGTVDIVARTIGQRLTADTGQSFVIDNRGGAAGTIATALVARAAPDGQTLLFHHMGLVFNASLYRALPFDTQKDIAPVAYIGSTPNVLVVNKSLPIRTVKEFLDYARAKPGAINYGSGGVGSAGHLPMELLQSETHVQLTHVPYKGSGPALTDLLGGRIQAMLLTIPAVMPLIGAGSVRAIATSGRKRSPALPDLPTLAESGIE
jgi:tripartite-type tricarboxylate transporter receptor subunit TctC